MIPRMAAVYQPGTINQLESYQQEYPLISAGNVKN